jgi:hypothetical protein
MMHRAPKYRCNLGVWVVAGLPLLFGWLILAIGPAAIWISTASGG